MCRSTSGLSGLSVVVLYMVLRLDHGEWDTLKQSRCYKLGAKTSPNSICAVVDAKVCKERNLAEQLVVRRDRED